MNTKYTVVNLESERAKGRKWIFGPFRPQEDTTFSATLELGYVNLNEVETTDQLHFHTTAEEYYVMMSGYMRINVESEIIEVSAGEVLVVRSNTEHLILYVQPNTRILLLKSPASTGDKVVIAR